jgi:hypothetical protein
MNRFCIASLCLAFVVAGGCRQNATPPVQAEKVTSAKPDWRLVTLHIDGFKKSKSGGT